MNAGLSYEENKFPGTKPKKVLKCGRDNCDICQTTEMVHHCFKMK